MIEFIQRFAPPLLSGMLLGAFFFGGLWLTVRQLKTLRHPAVLFALSAMVRTAVVLFGIWSVAGHDAGAALFCLLGFVVVRSMAIGAKNLSSRGNDTNPEPSARGSSLMPERPGFGGTPQ